MLDIRPIPIAQLLDQGRALAIAHGRESEPHIAAAHAPCVDTYQALEQSDSLVTLGVFHGESLVGYGTAVVSRHLHYGLPFGYCDLIYIDPAFRLGPAGLRLMRALADAAEERGARWMAWAAKPGSTLQRLLDRAGLPVEEITYREDLWDSAAAA